VPVMPKAAFTQDKTAIQAPSHNKLQTIRNPKYAKRNKHLLESQQFSKEISMQ
jgi:hypothetical protein